MKTSSTIAVLFTISLLTSFAASLSFTSAMTDEQLHNSLINQAPTNGQANQGPMANFAVPAAYEDPGNPRIAGDVGSGWKPEVKMTPDFNDSVNPSMGTYINSATGAVSLFCAVQEWDDANPRWVLRIYRSDNNGNSWYWILVMWWGAYPQRSIIHPSLAVSPYNATLFVATQDTAVPASGLSNDIRIWRININNPGDNQQCNIDADADDDQSPELVSEYSWGTSNYLYVTYEKYIAANDRDLYIARSIDWAQTWWTQPLIGSTVAWVYNQASITYAQRNLYIAFRDAATYSGWGYVSLAYSTDYGSSYNFVYNITENPQDASWPAVAGSRYGPAHSPTTVIVAYEANTTSSNHDILYSFSLDYGASWSGGSDSYHQIAVSASYEQRPELAVDGMGTEDMSVGGNYHLIYQIGNDIYYTQLPYFDIPIYYGGHAFWGYYFGWTTPHGKVTSEPALASQSYPTMTITTFKRTVGGQPLWEPGVAWTDFRSTGDSFYDIYYSTPDADFSITFVPSSQTVVAGKSLAYYVTINRLAGPTNATAYIGGTPHWPTYQSVYVTHEYSISQLTPTGSTTLTLYTSNLMPAGNKEFTATATIGGYRRMMGIPYVVTAPPTLTLNLNPTTVARGAVLTISGQLSPAPGSAQTIYLYYRLPHQTGTWALATTLTTNVAGAYNAAATVPMGLPVGQLDLVAFWVNTQNGAYAVSPIKLLTIT
ncbi:MAG: hypothetical protein ACE14S_00925 [Candidatus Bathyarchaeia archaeon]